MANSNEFKNPIPPHFVTIRALNADRARYEVEPPFQRRRVWPLRFQQGLIDSLLRGDPIPSLEGYAEENTDGETKYNIHEGHQRLSTILAYLDREFKTWTPGQKRRTEPNSEPPIEPNKYVDELSSAARNRILDTTIQINLARIENITQAITRFLRLQSHLPLTAAERLNAYQSKAKYAARSIEDHSFWREFYVGRTNRKQVFQSSLYILAIELARPGAMLDLYGNEVFHRLATGQRDAEIHDSLADGVTNRLEVLVGLYHGLEPFSVRALVIPMYQSVVFLEQAGYVVRPRDKGKLAKWIRPLMLQAKRTQDVPNWVVPMQLMVYRSKQEEFWRNEYPRLLRLFGIVDQAA